jgi:hypothetical protein
MILRIAVATMASLIVQTMAARHGTTLQAQADPRVTACHDIIDRRLWTPWHSYWEGRRFPVSTLNTVDSVIRARAHRDLRPQAGSRLWPPNESQTDSIQIVLSNLVGTDRVSAHAVGFALVHIVVDPNSGDLKAMWAGQVYRHGTYSETPAAVALGDLELPIWARDRVLGLLREAPPDSTVLMGVFRSLCQIAVWSSGLTPPPDGEDVTVIDNALTTDGRSLLTGLLDWLGERNGQFPAEYLPCRSWAECFGGGSLVETLASRRVGALRSGS